MNTHQILQWLSDEPSTKRKLEMLQSFKTYPLLQRIVAMALDKVRYTYGITMRNVMYAPEAIHSTGHGITLTQALDSLEMLYVTRTVTGNTALAQLAQLLEQLSNEDAGVIVKILGRDLKCGVGRTMANKVWPGLITKPPYMRCGVFGTKTAKHIEYPALLQVKEDGRFLYAIVDSGSVTYMSRQGEEDNFPQLTEEFLKMPDGVYIGELMVRGVANRSEANGLLNSDEASEANVYVHLWDYVTNQAFASKLSTVPYIDRLGFLTYNLSKLQSTKLYPVLTEQVNNLQEALALVSQWMGQGLEGGVLKNFNLQFRDHTSNEQLKLKLEMDIEVRCLGFTEGTKGTKRERTFGALVYSNDEGTIQGQCSGFTDAQLLDISNNRDDYIGQVLTVQFNDLSKSRDKDYYALMHPRFITFRNDKNSTNTLAEALEIRAMAMQLGA